MYSSRFWEYFIKNLQSYFKKCKWYSIIPVSPLYDTHVCMYFLLIRNCNNSNIRASRLILEFFCEMTSPTFVVENLNFEGRNFFVCLFCTIYQSFFNIPQYSFLDSLQTYIKNYKKTYKSFFFSTSIFSILKLQFFSYFICILILIFLL